MISILLALSLIGSPVADEAEAVESEQVQLAESVRARAAALAQMLADQKALAESAAKGCRPPFDWIAPTVEAYAPPAEPVVLPPCLQTCDCPQEPPATPAPPADTSTQQ